MEQAESSSDSPRIFTKEKWFVQLGMAARGIACCSKGGTSGRTVMQVPAFKLPACSRVTGKREAVGSSVGSVSRNAHLVRLDFLTRCRLRRTNPAGEAE